MFFISFCFFANLVFCAHSIADEFESYRGNRDNLAKVLRIMGTRADLVDRRSKTMDQVLSDKYWFLSLYKFINFEKESQLYLGGLLSDLSGGYFDELCTLLDANYLDYEGFEKGYPYKRDSKWKQASSSGRTEKAYLESSVDCDILLADPKEFITRTKVETCLKQLSVHKDEDGFKIRQALRSHRWFPLFYIQYYEAYHRHPDEFIDIVVSYWGKKAEFNFHNIFIPYFMTREHLQPLVDKIKARECQHCLPLYTNSKDEDFVNFIAELNREIRNQDEEIGLIGFDSEPFMDRWVIPESERDNQGSLFFHFLMEFPYTVKQAIKFAIFHGHYRPLKNIIVALTELYLDYQETIELGVNYITDNSRFQETARSMKALQILLPYAQNLPHMNYEFNYYLLPILEELKAAPENYWHPNLIERGKRWVEKQLKKIPAQESDLLTEMNKYPDLKEMDVSFMLCIYRGWKEARSLISISEPFRYSAVNSLHLRLIKEVPVIRDQFWKDLADPAKKVFPSIALSANYEMLELIADIFKPHLILSVIESPKIRKRISLMLHLLPRVQSYLGMEIVNKNSLYFRNWVLISFQARGSHALADLKLIHFYFQNLTQGKYEGFEGPCQNSQGKLYAFGVVHDPSHEAGKEVYQEGWELSFEPA